MIVVGVAIFSLWRVIEKNNTSWEVYKNIEAGYELSHPSNWYVFKIDCFTICGNSRDPSECESECQRSFRVQNKKNISSKSKTEMYCKSCSYFQIHNRNLVPEYPLIKTMEDWITKNELTYHEYKEPEGLIHEAVKERDKEEYEEKKKNYIDRAKKSQQEEIRNLVEMEVGDIKTKVSVHEVNSYTWRLDFIYDGKLYEIAYVSGSPEQFEKNNEIFKTIIHSLRIY